MAPRARCGRPAVRPSVRPYRGRARVRRGAELQHGRRVLRRQALRGGGEGALEPGEERRVVQRPRRRAVHVPGRPSSVAPASAARSRSRPPSSAAAPAASSSERHGAADAEGSPAGPRTSRAAGGRT
eukprot:scaffold1300_cov317-Prasinococcus_capsulatus_cf.AAC.16